MGNKDSYLDDNFDEKIEELDKISEQELLRI